MKLDIFLLFDHDHRIFNIINWLMKLYWWWNWFGIPSTGLNDLRVVKESIKYFKLISWVWNFCHYLYIKEFEYYLESIKYSNLSKLWCILTFVIAYIKFNILRIPNNFTYFYIKFDAKIFKSVGKLIFWWSWIFFYYLTMIIAFST